MNAAITPSPEHDAQTRAFRTLIQGLAVDLAAAIATAAAVAIAGGIEWTQAYWVALALAVAKSAVTAIVSYFARKLIPPANEDPRNAS
jgi:Na+/melibiose symporter-like transporter